jgi:hypothetical protein
MEHNPEQVYTDLLRQLASPAGTAPEVLANAFRNVERMHSMGQITDWQLQNAREAYARTPGSKIGEAASWAMGKAKDTVESAAEYVRDRATSGRGDVHQGGSRQGDPDRRRHWCSLNAPPCDDRAVGSANRQAQSSEMNRR